MSNEDTLKSLGKLIADSSERDAVHIAVAPICARDRLAPGQHVGIGDDGMATGAVDFDDLVGIVDPFLPAPVFKGERFWLFLYPGSITSLRHDWTHPAFSPVRTAFNEKASSEAWLKGYANDMGLSVGAVIEAARGYLMDGSYYTFSHDTPGRANTEAAEFWRHYQIITGEQVENHEATFFTCAC